ncbi:capsular exopolysaccharide family [Succiniclasticum ruminis]|uniref:Capsular exopolysaccharide family n=1 Tax=Succiniclasticum ruminis TaxID=40841 RepID=A0A1G6HRE4_9FIRM|nr:CpsD/CapB family tyrosine-protein kinase [Succiniclasticum ruminis]SDB96754.1 capsular exopolysaccharide family [Succiniclasticum ruminis]
MGKKELTAMKDPSGLQYDAYQAICMKLQAKAKQAEKPVRVIVVTSTTAEEGQEAVAADLAVVMAKTGVKMLLLDCDFRTPVLHEMFQLPNRGLTDCLAAGADYHEFVQHVFDTDLDIVTGGTPVTNAGELLSGRPMQDLLQTVRVEYDYVFVNTPPVLASADTISVSSKADGVILVIASGKNEAKLINKAKVTLEQTGASLLGCILNNTTEE